MLNETQKPTNPRVYLALNRTSMAGSRTPLAMDRTKLTGIRTTLTMAKFGFGMVAFFRSIRQESPSEETSRVHQGRPRR